ncbi:calcitonin/calcitonin-related polypeptide, alpha isoform X1 [Nelusetta ayraudi]|uniref:calcitonin/calcitonin-related polypeptide, alpha isoform X1 n=1 Tax=Nelusetta ayraudi TaxID=303726 RepID=UPI003F70725B
MRFLYKSLHKRECPVDSQVSLSLSSSAPDALTILTGIMLLKLWTLLLPYVLIICQTYISEGAPFRSSKESMSDGVSLFNDDTQRLFKVIKELMQRSLDEQELSMAEGYSNATTQKRGCNTATCVTHRLADFLSRSGGLGHSNFVPTNVGAQAFGRRKRHSPV